jgi:hypothetical protein
MNPLDRLGPRPDLAVIRDDVRAIDAYPVPSAVGFVKLDAMENPFSLPEGLQQKLGIRFQIREDSRSGSVKPSACPPECS